MLVALDSMDQIWKNKQKNRIIVSDHVKIAVEEGADLIIFPEMTLTGYSMDIAEISEDAAHSETVDFFKNLARGRLAIVFGMAYTVSGRAKNMLIVVNEHGELVSEYAKIHPFSFAGEQNYFDPGNSLSEFDIGSVRFGCSICYDLRFPALYQAMSDRCDVVINIANWPSERRQHWEILLRARAIENQLFTIGVNRTGTDGNDINYARTSYVFDPIGERVIPDSTTGTIDMIRIDPFLLKSVRCKFPFLKDKRNNFYSKLYAS